MMTTVTKKKRMHAVIKMRRGLCTVILKTRFPRSRRPSRWPSNSRPRPGKFSGTWGESWPSACWLWLVRSPSMRKGASDYTATSSCDKKKSETDREICPVICFVFWSACSPKYFYSSQVLPCLQPSQPSISCCLYVCARGGPSTFPSAIWDLTHSVWCWASSRPATCSACTCTRVCWPRPCSLHILCGPGTPASVFTSKPIQRSLIYCWGYVLQTPRDTWNPWNGDLLTFHYPNIC